MNLNSEIQLITDKIIQEKLSAMIETHVSSMINSVVKDVFCSYGETSKELKKRIEEKLDVNLQEFDLLDYNALVAKTINDNLVQQVNLQPILDLTQNSIGFLKKKEITLQEISEMFILASQEENESSGEGEITFIIEENDQYDWIEIFADIEPDTKKQNCSINFIVSTKSNKIFSFRTREKYYDKNLSEVSPARLTNLSAIEHKIFRLYSGVVRVNIKDLDVQTYWDRY